MNALSLPSEGRLPLPILQGERCLLRALGPGDAVSLRDHADNVEVWRNLFEGFASPYLAANAEAWCGHEANSGEFGYIWGIVVDGAVIGCIGVQPQERAGARCNAELGYWIGERYWRRGIASDAVTQVVDWAFAALPGITRIVAPIYLRNEGSQAVAKRCGFVREGIHRHAAIKDGQVIDLSTWAIYRTATPPRAADIDAALAITANNAMERA
jgi:ribosomal-protein-alanine N-acetyltransferase